MSVWLTRTVLGHDINQCGETLERQCYGTQVLQGVGARFASSVDLKPLCKDLFPVLVPKVSEVKRQMPVRKCLVNVIVNGNGNSDELLAEQTLLETWVRDSFEQFPTAQ